MKRLMLIGFGAMAKEVVSRLPDNIRVEWVVTRESHREEIEAFFAGGARWLPSPEACADKPDLVLECASQQAVRQFGESVLSRGWTLAIISTGALADEELELRLRQAEKKGHGQVMALSGAVAGMDGLSAAKEGGLVSVTYQSSKSPASWRGSPAEVMVDLDNVREPTVFFEGSAREAASLFPANANVAATIALYGLGMDNTRVRLQVDPKASRNSHRIEVTGGFGEFQVDLSGFPLSSNPKTSMLAALSAVEVCRRLANDHPLI